jgi:hypothetical protein
MTRGRHVEGRLGPESDETIDLWQLRCRLMVLKIINGASIFAKINSGENRIALAGDQTGNILRGCRNRRQYILCRGHADCSVQEVTTQDSSTDCMLQWYLAT